MKKDTRGALEIVFNSREFDLNDDVLMEFNNYFDKENRDYNSFSLDEEDILILRNLQRIFAAF